MWPVSAHDCATLVLVASQRRRKELVLKCYFVTFGCKVNTCETAGMRAMLQNHGYTVTDDPAQADLILFNSCTVTASGDSRLFAAMRKMRHKYPHARLVLTGCYAQAFPEEAAKILEADLIVGTKNRSRLPFLLDALFAGCAGRVSVENYTSHDCFELLPCDTMPENTRAFLKVQDGCNCFCSYCIIPYARGSCRSLSPEQVAQRAAAFASNGYREIVLCGINLGFYGMEWNETLAQAAEICAHTPGICRVRLSSLEPERLDAQTLRRLAALPEFCPQFHLSLQSGCDRTLQQMKRRYTSVQYAQICAAIREMFQDAAITTDFMVGFPGETQADFAQSLAFAEKIGFAAMHVFRYSPRPGTRAAQFPEQVEERVKSERMKLAQSLAKASKKAFLQSQIGKIVPVLLERERGDGFHVGHAPNGTIVRFMQKNLKKSLRNQVFYVRIEESDADCCYGTPVTTDANAE